MTDKNSHSRSLCFHRDFPKLPFLPHLSFIHNIFSLHSASSTTPRGAGSFEGDEFDVEQQRHLGHNRGGWVVLRRAPFARTRAGRLMSVLFLTMASLASSLSTLLVEGDVIDFFFYSSYKVCTHPGSCGSELWYSIDLVKARAVVLFVCHSWCCCCISVSSACPSSFYFLRAFNPCVLSGWFENNTSMF